jgi:hypothetical protein
MPGTRTAPTISGTPTYKIVSLTWYDYTGEQRTDSYQMDADSTAAEIEAFAVAMQALSNATLWRVGVADTYNSVGDSSNALEQVWEDAETNLVFLAKTSLNVANNLFVPAPINAAFVEGTEEIDPTNAEIAALLAAWLPMRAGFSVVSGRFTQRRSIGTKVII